MNLALSRDQAERLARALANPSTAAQIIDCAKEAMNDVGAAFERKLKREDVLPGDEDRIELFDALVDRFVSDPANRDQVREMTKAAFRSLVEVFPSSMPGSQLESENVAGLLFEKLAQVEEEDPELAAEIRADLSRGERNP
jgi:hypothetical protein